jgi:hypothetical protein
MKNNKINRVKMKNKTIKIRDNRYILQFTNLLKFINIKLYYLERK